MYIFGQGAFFQVLHLTYEIPCISMYLTFNSVKKSHCCNSGDDVESGFHFYNETFITPFSAEDFDLNLQDFNVTLGSNTVNVSWTHVHPCITGYFK